MSNFFFAFFALLIIGYTVLILPGSVMGAELAIVIILVMLVALVVSLLISQNEKLDRLTEEVKSLQTRLDGEIALEETDHETR